MWSCLKISMSYNNRVYLHGYCSSFIHYFSICFSLLSTLSGSQVSLSTVYSLLTLTSLSFHLSLSPPISPQSTDHTSSHWSHRSHSPLIRSQQANDAMVELSGTWRVGLMGIDSWGIDRVDGGFWWVINGFGIEWVSDWVSWFFLMMVVGCGVIMGSDGLWVCERGREGVNNKKL